MCACLICNFVTMSTGLQISTIQRNSSQQCHNVWVCGWFGGSVGQWVGSGEMTKNLINLDLIEI